MTKSAYLVVRIVAAVVDTHRLTLYKEDGLTISVLQGDPNLRRIVEQATPQLLQQGWADVQLEPPPENSYAQFEQESSGLVRFFKIAKAKLKELMVEPAPVIPDTRPVVPMSIGQVPSQATDVKVIGQVLEVPVATPATESSITVLGGFKFTPAIPEALVSKVADIIEEFGEDELERYRDEQEDKKAALAATSSEPDLVKTAANLDMSGVYASTTEVEAVETESVEELVQIEQTADDKRAADAVAEILAHAMPVTDPGFHEKTIGKQGAITDESGHTSNELEEPDAPDTIIAVVGNRVIPGVEKIKSQFARAAKMGSTVGVEKFLQRIGAVIKDRAHSIDELLTFMERGDLPIADDGSILIYKVLNHAGTKEGHKVYVDCHSGNVIQWEGAYVCMDPKMVDMNRRAECSVGLHVARRGYVRGFGGSVCVLGKLAPEDVIAVPHGEANKLRACGYHIIKELTPAQHDLLKRNRPISDDPEGKVLLADAIAGRHIRITHRVEIRGRKGSDVVTTEVAEADAPVHQVPEAKPVEQVEALPDSQKVELADPVDPVGVAKEVTKAVEHRLSQKEQATILYETWWAAVGSEGEQKALAELLYFKKGAKKSWDVLGIPDPTKEEGHPTPEYGMARPTVAKVHHSKEPNRKSQQKAAKVKAPSKPVKEKNVETKTEKQPLTRTVNGVVLDNPGGGTPRERIHKILAGGGITSVGQAQAILDIKKKSKKAWGALGVSDDVATQVMKLAGKTK